AGKVRGGHILVGRNRNQGYAELPGHVLDEPGLAASGRSLEHDRQALGIGRLKDRNLVAERLIVRLGSDPIGVEIHQESSVGNEGSMFSRPSATVPSRMGMAAFAGNTLQHRSASIGDHEASGQLERENARPTRSRGGSISKLLAG